MTAMEPATQSLHGPAAELLKTLQAYSAGYISAEELRRLVEDLFNRHEDLFQQNPHALHLYAMACEELNWADKAIPAYAEAAVQLALIEDLTREAAAYSALARLQHDCGDIDGASFAASQAMFVYLHLGDTPKLAVHRLYDFCLRAAKTNPDAITTPRADLVVAAIRRYARRAIALYTCK